MRGLRLAQWRSCVQSQCIRPLPPSPHHIILLQIPVQIRHAATVSNQVIDDTTSPSDENAQSNISTTTETHIPSKADAPKYPRHKLPSPPPTKAPTSTRLSALHARLALPKQVPINTLARCLIDASADSHPDFNNKSMSVLGQDLLSYLTSEAILSQFPRLPTEVVYSAMAAYIGPKTSAIITKEWGVETVHTPGAEVDPGLLQFARREPGNALSRAGVPIKDIEDTSEPLSATRPNAELMQRGWRRGVSSRTMYEDSLGKTVAQDDTPQESDLNGLRTPTTYEAASTTFVRALIGALYLHTGLRTTKTFYNAHFYSRHLDVSALFSFRQPTRDLARLCAREGFERPLARILSETGRKSRHPVFIVGIFSGREKLGESSGASLDEARFRAAVAALKGWYLYSPLKWKVPSDAVGRPGGDWEPLLVDGGEVIV